MSFTYRAFHADATPGLTLDVTDRMLPTQRHLLPVIAAIDKCIQTGDQTWRLHLRVEETEPFDLEFATVAREIGVARFRRGDLDAILL